MAAKILEEAHGLFAASRSDNAAEIIKESADVLEIMLAKQRARRQSRGGFDDRILLETTGAPLAGLPGSAQAPRFIFNPILQKDLLAVINAEMQKSAGVDVFHPNTGEVRRHGAEGIACWFVDTDYSEESFFVRQAYFLGANDPYKALKTTLKAEINREAWQTLRSDTSRPFAKPASGRIAVKVQSFGG